MRPVEKPHRIGSRTTRRGRFSGRVQRRNRTNASGGRIGHGRCGRHRRGQRRGDAGGRQSHDACIREIASARAALPLRSPWTSRGRVCQARTRACYPGGASVCANGLRSWKGRNVRTRWTRAGGEIREFGHSIRHSGPFPPSRPSPMTSCAARTVPISRASSDGETRTRTGDTTISVVRPAHLNSLDLQGVPRLLAQSRGSALSRTLRSFPRGYGRRRHPSAFSPGRPTPARGAGG
jgi:hypothetical protein